ncbi:Protein amalgam [Amphibalanus amphitrite]|uniref:Protein amalgam n=1 Tax=Amphibalanus amphitrite TaxID=1232801 RepID=A0A6A4VZZ8_AMPAM|nr:Protein amalgam [Amphibalanus amphitrite]
MIGDVLYGPTVVTVPQSGVVVAERGTDETLQCTADGKPQPTITWRKQSGDLPGGEKVAAGERYTVSDITRQMAGVYECVADNGLGQVAVGAIRLQVHYPPEVEVEKSTVYTGEGYSVVLVCFVYADPPAKVIWDREDSTFDSSRHSEPDEVVMGTRHELVIQSVGRDDFGRYSCKATNSLGTMTRHMSVTGVADRVEITSEPVSTAPDVYDLSWQVQSFSPVQEYKVAYRRSKHNISVEQPSVWKEVIVPTTGSEPVGDVLYHQRITLRGLEPATAYDLKIQARNAHGWNAVSDQFRFATLTRGEDWETLSLDESAGPAPDSRLVVSVCVEPVVCKGATDPVGCGKRAISVGGKPT